MIKFINPDIKSEYDNELNCLKIQKPTTLKDFHEELLNYYDDEDYSNLSIQIGERLLIIKEVFSDSIVFNDKSNEHIYIYVIECNKLYEIKNTSR